MLRRIWTIIDKEWSEILRNRLVVTTILALPVIISSVPIALLEVVGDRAMSLSELNLDAIPEEKRDEPPFNLIDDPQISLQIYVGQQISLIYMILPLAIPMTIAAYSIVGEKKERSLEPLLATPIRTWELLVAKSLAAAIPGIISTWAGCIIFILGVSFVANSDYVVEAIITDLWLVSIFILAPLMTITATIIGLIISSRVNDPRVAEQLGMLMVLPVVGLVIGQLVGVLYWDIPLILITIIIIVTVNAVLIWLAGLFFNRENILTRWKF